MKPKGVEMHCYYTCPGHSASLAVILFWPTLFTTSTL